MAKKRKKEQMGEMPDFIDIYKNSPKEIQDMMDEMGVSSFEDLMGLALMLGIDPMKMEKYTQEHGVDQLPPLEDILMDDDSPFRDVFRQITDDDDDFDTDDDAELNPFELPQKCFFQDVPVQKLHFRIKLNNAPVPIWREVEVPSNISLEVFALVIIEAMGWENVHLHMFRDKKTIYKNNACLKEDEKIGFSLFSPISKFSTEDRPVSALFNEKGRRIKFEYDFGDSWEHDVWLKGSSEYQPFEYPRLRALKGEGACPPEDSGGVWGYGDLLEIFSKKRKTADEKERLQWYDIGKNFNPHDFDIEFAQDNLDSLWEWITEE